MLSTRKLQTISGGSYVEVDGKDIQAAVMSASLDDKGNRNESVNIVNQALYEVNREAIESDIAEFKQLADSLLITNYDGE